MTSSNQDIRQSLTRAFDRAWDSYYRSPVAIAEVPYPPVPIRGTRLGKPLKGVQSRSFKAR